MNTARISRLLRRSAVALPLRAALLPATGPSLTARYARQAFVHLCVRRKHRREVYEVIWEEAARSVGATFARTGSGLEIARDGRAVTLHTERTPLDDDDVLARALDKRLTRQLLLARGLPVPDQVAFSISHLRPAITFLQASDGPCVLKPASGSGGNGVTCGVETIPDLRRALAFAAAFESRFVLERQVPGEMYRALVLDGELLAVVRRSRPRVVGDGRADLGTLVTRENQMRLERRAWAGFSLVRPDLEFALTLRALGLDVRSVLPDATPLSVKASSGESGAADAETIELEDAQSVAADSCAAAQALGLRLAGVDIVSIDLRRQLHAGDGAIIEVNGKPGLHFHYLVPDQSPVARVAIPVLSRVLGLA